MYKVTKYPDGSSYVDTDKMSHETVRINSYEDLWHLHQLVDAKKNLGLRPTIIIPNLLDAQADRRFKDGQSTGARLVLNLLASMEADFKLFHPHNPEIVEAICGNVAIMDNTGFIKNVMERMKPRIQKGDGKLIFMSPDAGAFKSLSKTLDAISWNGEMYSATKARSFEDFKTKLVQQIDRQDFEGNSVLIVDDICVGGGTFIGLAKMLRERNVGKLFLAVSHMALEDVRPEIFELFDYVYTTNSKYENYFIPDGEGGTQPANLDVLKLFNPTQYV